MSVIGFPANPIEGDVFTLPNGVQYVYNGQAWDGSKNGVATTGSTPIVFDVNATPDTVPRRDVNGDLRVRAINMNILDQIAGESWTPVLRDLAGQVYPVSTASFVTWFNAQSGFSTGGPVGVEAATPSTIPIRDANADIFVRAINMNIAEQMAATTWIPMLRDLTGRVVPVTSASFVTWLNALAGVTVGSRPYAIKTAAYAAAIYDKVGLNVTGGGFTVTLPAVKQLGQSIKFAVLVGDASIFANNVTIDGNGSNIEGDPTFTVDGNVIGFSLVWNATEWKVIIE